MASKPISTELEPKEIEEVSMDIAEDTDEITLILNAEDVADGDIEITVGWYQDGTRVGGKSEKLDNVKGSEGGTSLRPFADTLKLQIRNDHDSKKTVIRGNLREKKRG